MNSRTRETPLQCVNCGIHMKRLKRRWMAEESDELRQLLTDWSCKEHEESDVTCTECYNLLHLGLESEDKSRRFGHKHVCLSCGLSLNSARSVSLTDHPEQKLVAAQWAPAHQVKRLESICHKCWLKADRRVQQKNGLHSEANSRMGTMRKERSESHGVQVKIEPLDSILGYGELDIPMSSESEEEVIPDKHPQPPSISMETFKRAADTGSRCIFKQCTNQNRLTPPKVLVERLLVDYSFYIPAHSRVCDKHRESNHQAWNDLVNSSQITDFSIAHIENLCSILKNIQCNGYCRDFENRIKQDEFLCKYWLGVNYKQYEEMIETIKPNKKQMGRIRKALAIYLMTKHTGFSYEKLSKFFGEKPKMLVKIFKRVHGYLESKEDSDDS